MGVAHGIPGRVMFGGFRRGWVRRALKFMRWSRVAAYVMIASAGVASLAFPPASIESASDNTRFLQLSWAGLMALSAGFCAWGAARDRWVGEWIGLVPLSLVAAAFGISALARGTSGWSGGLFLFGFFWILVSRWQEVALLRSEADRQARIGGNGEGGIPQRRGGE